MFRGKFWTIGRSLEEKMPSVRGLSFGMVMQADSLMEFSFDVTCLGKVTSSTKEVMMFEVVVGWLRGWF